MRSVNLKNSLSMTENEKSTRNDFKVLRSYSLQGDIYSPDFWSNSIFNVYSPWNFLVITHVSAIEFGHVYRSLLVIFFGHLNQPQVLPWIKFFEFFVKKAEPDFVFQREWSWSSFSGKSIFWRNFASSSCKIIINQKWNLCGKFHTPLRMVQVRVIISCPKVIN